MPPANAPDPFPGETVLVRPLYTNPSGPVLGYEVVSETDSFTAREVDSFDDFLYEVYDASSPWIGLVSGAGAGCGAGAALIDLTEKAIGMVQMETGTTNAGRASLYNGRQQWLFGAANVRWCARVAVLALSTAGEEFDFCVGFHDAIETATLDATDGIYFKYNRAVTGNFWVCVTASNGVLSQTTTTIAPSANAFQVLEIEVLHETLVGSTGGIPGVYFRIDGAHAALHTTTLPVSNGRLTGEGYRIKKQAGVTSRFACVDYRRHRIRQGADR